MLEMEPVVLKNIEFDFEEKPLKNAVYANDCIVPMQATYLASCLSSNFTWKKFQWDLDERGSVGTFVDKKVGFSRRTRYIWKICHFYAHQPSNKQTKKHNVWHLKTAYREKIVD